MPFHSSTATPNLNESAKITPEPCCRGEIKRRESLQYVPVKAQRGEMWITVGPSFNRQKQVRNHHDKLWRNLHGIAGSLQETSTKHISAGKRLQQSIRRAFNVSTARHVLALVPMRHPDVNFGDYVTFGNIILANGAIQDSLFLCVYANEILLSRCHRMFSMWLLFFIIFYVHDYCLVMCVESISCIRAMFRRLNNDTKPL